jgi:hypothetical protein
VCKQTKHDLEQFVFGYYILLISPSLGYTENGRRSQGRSQDLVEGVFCLRCSSVISAIAYNSP